MVLYTIRRSLGSLIISFCLLACTNSTQTNERVISVIETDSCQLKLSLGDVVMAKLGECRYCHLRGRVGSHGQFEDE